jgi:hypothetical protein
LNWYNSLCQNCGVSGLSWLGDFYGLRFYLLNFLFNKSFFRRFLWGNFFSLFLWGFAPLLCGFLWRFFWWLSCLLCLYCFYLSWLLKRFQ